MRVFLGGRETYGLRDIVDYDGTVCIPIVHGCQRLVSFLTGCIPDFEFDGCGVVEGDGLGEEGGADGGFAVVVELVLFIFISTSASATETFAFRDKAGRGIKSDVL